MKKAHKHAELIKAWADGAEIEWKGVGMNTGLPYFKMDDGKIYVAHTFTVYDLDTGNSRTLIYPERIIHDHFTVSQQG